MTVFSPMQYGWGLRWWVTIEGVPVVWIDGTAATGATLPSGYGTEVAALLIDDSAQIGSEVAPFEGVGKSLPFTLRLRDTSTTRAYLKRWSAESLIASDVTAAATTIVVADNSVFSAGQNVWLGNECITIGAINGDGVSLTGCTRGVAGDAYEHRAGSVGGLVTDLPRWWRGREVQLWATPIDPTGYLAGGVLAGDAELVWRGTIDKGPRRDGLHFVFEAMGIDRKLTAPLGSVWSGRLVDTDKRYPVYTQSSFIFQVQIFDSGGASLSKDRLRVYPFPSDSDGDMLAASTIRQRIVTGVATAVTAAGVGARIGAWKWVGEYYIPPKSGSAVSIWKGYIGLAANANARTVVVKTLKLLGFGAGVEATQSVASITSGAQFYSGWMISHDPSKTGLLGAETEWASSATIAVTDGDPATVPSTGVLVIGDAVFTYKQATYTAGAVYLASLTTVAGKKAGTVGQPGTEAEILSGDGTPAVPARVADAVRRMIASSGTSGLRDAMYDTLALGQGYALAGADFGQIGQVLNSGALGDIRVQIAPRDESLEEIFGGMLALSGRALAMRPAVATRSAEIHAVDLNPAAGYSLTLSDADLLTSGGGYIQAERVDDAPNVIRIKCQQGGEDVLVLSFRDAPAAQAQGARVLEVTAPVADRSSFVVYATIWARSIFASSQTRQILKIRVPPWVDCDVGDGALLAITHPGVWDYKTGTPGASGVGRCIGRHIEPSSGAVELTILAGGIVSEGTLCPSAQIQATDHVTAPTYLDLPLIYLSHMGQALTAAAGNVRLLLYRKGQTESVSNGYNISAAALSGGLCRVTVASNVGTPTLPSTSPTDAYVTLPESANDDAFQARFMHDADGSRFI